MVKLGFIVEGATEKIILEHSDFFSYLTALKLEYISEVIDAKGNGNLLPRNIRAFTQVLKDKGATRVFILTDLDNDQCITNTKTRINAAPHHFVVVSVKAVEAWFLADSGAMRSYLGDSSFYSDLPESPHNPFEEIKRIRKTITGKGFTDKRVLANSIVHKHKFSVIRAGQHPNCNSAKYFLKTIRSVMGLAE